MGGLKKLPPQSTDCTLIMRSDKRGEWSGVAIRYDNDKDLAFKLLGDEGVIGPEPIGVLLRLLQLVHDADAEVK